MPKQRTTQRFRRTLLWATERFSSLADVRETYKCSNSLIYKTVFEQLELRCRQYEYLMGDLYLQGNISYFENQLLIRK